jgi:demethylmenaquinone methyltransferase / 2-methoxy-6-polyprenyl-1,4-benzoquinol methylase
LSKFAVKESEVELMFNGIAPRYDFLNHLLSFGIDKLWRKRLVKGVIRTNPTLVLDVATGTGDLAIALAKRSKQVRITGIDIADAMLDISKRKLHHLGFSARVSMERASSLSLPFPDNHFDAAMVSFGVRNFEDPLKGLSEMQRVVKPGGTINVLEFTTPRIGLVRWVYNFYFNRILPWVGKKISGHGSAYTYLPTSVNAFKEREDFVELLEQSGFANARYKLQSFGIAAIYQAVKPILK